MTSKKGTLIIGATAQGMQAALTLGRLGRKVTLIDRNIDIASPPRGWSDKGKRWIHYLRTQISYHPFLELSTETEASNIRQNKEDVEVELTQGPRWVLPDLCVDCQKCLSSCPVDLSNGRKPIFELKTPTTIAIDKREKAPCRLACPIGMNPQGYVALIGQGRFDEAMEGFKRFLDRYPKSELADNAQYWIGECYMALKKYDRAIAAYEDVKKKYPEGNKVPDAMLKQAMAFLEKGDEISTRILLKRIVSAFPESDQAKVAEQRLETLK